MAIFALLAEMLCRRRPDRFAAGQLRRRRKRVEMCRIQWIL